MTFRLNHSLSAFASRMSSGGGIVQIDHKCGTGRIPSRRELWPSCRLCVLPPAQVTDLSFLLDMELSQVARFRGRSR